MQIIAIGDDQRYEELRKKLAALQIEITRITDVEEEMDEIKTADIIFDLNFDDDADNLSFYATLKDKYIFVSAVKTSLAEQVYLLGDKLKCKLIGMNAIPTFIDRERWELSLYYSFMADDVQKIMNQLKINYDIVADRVGMVTPRILFMIINEACYTLQEGTASIEDIDQGMKLGTSYPFGPFEWCDRIGITDVFETLVSIYEDTKEERYKICSLLKNKYLRNQTFYKIAK
ncbi:MAG: 3-hydroxyacyl-CoA dehydrogenase family protein [Bacteroidota bacterium]